jgi:hypothetical protein
MFTLKMEAGRSSEILAFYRNTTRRHIPEDLDSKGQWFFYPFVTYFVSENGLLCKHGDELHRSDLLKH